MTLILELKINSMNVFNKRWKVPDYKHQNLEDSKSQAQNLKVKG